MVTNRTTSDLRRSAGDLQHLVALDVRTEVNPDAPEDYGNTVANWVEQFQTAAGFINLRAGEAVMASRLQGQRTRIIFVRASIQTRAITTDWRLRDVRSGEIYNISEATPTNDRKWVDLLCQGGVAEG